MHKMLINKKILNRVFILVGTKTKSVLALVLRAKMKRHTFSGSIIIPGNFLFNFSHRLALERFGTDTVAHIKLLGIAPFSAGNIVIGFHWSE